MKSSILRSGVKIGETKTLIWTTVEVINAIATVEDTITFDEGTMSCMLQRHFF